MSGNAIGKCWLGTSLSLAALGLLVGAADAQTRSAGAHLHGVSELAIVQSGSRIDLQFTAPGSDIVGFEHETRTEDDRALVAAAIEILEAPLDLFVFRPAADCTVAEATARFSADHDDHHEEEDHDEDHDEDEDHHDDGGHAEFTGSYQLECTNFDAVSAIEFAIFDHFPGMETVNVQSLLERGAGRASISREDATYNL